MSATISLKTVAIASQITGKSAADITNILTKAQPALGQINYEVMIWFFIGWAAFILVTVAVALILDSLYGRKKPGQAVVIGITVGALVGAIVVGIASMVYMDSLIAQRIPDYKTLMDIVSTTTT